VAQDITSLSSIVIPEFWIAFQVVPLKRAIALSVEEAGQETSQEPAAADLCSITLSDCCLRLMFFYLVNRNTHICIVCSV